MEIKRLRNLTTGILHTDIGCVYEDLEYITGMTGLMTHMLPNVMRAVEPWLKTKVTEPEYWVEEYQPDAIGDYPLEPMDETQRQLMCERFMALPDPLTGKSVVVVQARESHNNG